MKQGRHRSPRPSAVEGSLALLIIIPALIVTRSFATLMSAMVAGVVVIVVIALLGVGLAACTAARQLSPSP